jgi:hypothetical protein
VVAEVTFPVVSQGQVVDVTLRNESAVQIDLPSSCTYGAIYAGTDCLGPPIAAFACLAVIVPIGPGQESTQSWVQTDGFGNPVPPGTYSFSISWWDAGFTTLSTCCVPVTITACSGPGSAYCSPVPTTTGLPSTLCADGSAVVADGDLTLVADGVPFGEFGFFLVSATQGEILPAASNGVLCLSGNIGRFNQPGQLFSGPSGSLALDLTAIPQNPATPVFPGDTYHFQAWHREGTSSNFTNALTVAFQ